MKKLILTLLLTGLTQLAIANPRYIPLSPENIGIPPRMNGAISLGALEQATPYEVICIIASAGTLPQKFVSIQPNFTNYTLSGKALSGIIKLPINNNNNNEYVIRTVVTDTSKMPALEFHNLDRDSFVNVYNCVAERHFGGNHERSGK